MAEEKKKGKRVGHQCQEQRLKRPTVYITTRLICRSTCVSVCVSGGGRVYALPVCQTHTIKICVPFTAADCSKMQMSCVTASLRLALKQPFGRLYYSVSGIRPV